MAGAGAGKNVFLRNGETVELELDGLGTV